VRVIRWLERGRMTAGPGRFGPTRVPVSPAIARFEVAAGVAGSTGVAPGGQIPVGGVRGTVVAGRASIDVKGGV